MPDTSIVSIRTRVITRPLLLNFSTALGHKNAMTSVLVEARLSDGSRGMGECATSFVLPDENVRKIREIIKQEALRIIGRDAAQYPSIITGARKRHPQFPMTLSGLETALFRAFIASSAKDEHGWFGARSHHVETDITIPFTDDECFLDTWISNAVQAGFTSYKIKVSGQYREDTRLVNRCSKILSEKNIAYSLRLDGNQGFREKTFLEFTDYLGKQAYPVELFEQPLPKDDWRGLKDITMKSPFPVILDESIFTVQDLERAIQEGVGHGVNIKIAKSGITQSLAILKSAQRHGFKIMAGCMTESMTGLSMAIYMAMGTQAFDYIDLDSIHFLKHKKQYRDILIEGPRYIHRSEKIVSCPL